MTIMMMMMMMMIIKMTRMKSSPDLGFALRQCAAAVLNRFCWILQMTLKKETDWIKMKTPWQFSTTEMNNSASSAKNGIFCVHNAVPALAIPTIHFWTTAFFFLMRLNPLVGESGAPKQSPHIQNGLEQISNTASSTLTCPKLETMCFIFNMDTSHTMKSSSPSPPKALPRNK